MAAATTWPPACSTMTTKVTARYAAMASCLLNRCPTRAVPCSTAPSTRYSSLRRRRDMTESDFTREFRERRETELLGSRSEIVTGPVSDWASDFTHLEPEWAADPYPIQ